MKRLLAILLCALPSLLQAGQATIHGITTIRKTGAPLQGTAIRILAMDGTLLDTTRSDASGTWSASITTSGIAQGPDLLPRDFALGQNFPNPFNPATHLPFRIARSGPVCFTVHNLLGQLLERRELALPAGSYDLEWRSSGSAGVLFYSLEVDGRRITRKMAPSWPSRR